MKETPMGFLRTVSLIYIYNNNNNLVVIPAYPLPFINFNCRTMQQISIKSVLSGAYNTAQITD
jgi:hypothetical protein